MPCFLARSPLFPFAPASASAEPELSFSSAPSFHLSRREEEDEVGGKKRKRKERKATFSARSLKRASEKVAPLSARSLEGSEASLPLPLRSNEDKQRASSLRFASASAPLEGGQTESLVARSAHALSLKGSKKKTKRAKRRATFSARSFPLARSKRDTRGKLFRSLRSRSRSLKEQKKEGQTSFARSAHALSLAQGTKKEGQTSSARSLSLTLSRSLKEQKKRGQPLSLARSRSRSLRFAHARSRSRSLTLTLAHAHAHARLNLSPARRSAPSSPCSAASAAACPAAPSCRSPRRGARPSCTAARARSPGTGTGGCSTCAAASRR